MCYICKLYRTVNSKLNFTMSSKHGHCVASFNGAQYAAPYVKNSVSQTAQDAVGVFFGGNRPDVQFQAPAFGQQNGPTTAFSTTTEARRWDHVINSYLIMEKMHEHQKFPLLLAPLELAKGMTFTTRVFTSNLEAPEEAPEHVPAPFSTTQWSETKTALTMVHRSVKFSLHELKTEKGQQDYKVHLSNLALMFLRDTHNVVLRKFARQNTLMQALMSFYPPNQRMHKELMHNTVRSFGMLNVNPTGLDALVANVKQVGTTQNVDYDSCVVPYGSLSNLALSRNNFVLTETAITLSQQLAKMADINHPAKVPTHVFQNEFSVFQHQKTADQMQNPESDPLANVAVVATYHPFGSDYFYMPGSRDIQVISASSNGWASLSLDDAVRHLSLPQFDATASAIVKVDATNEHNMKFVSSIFKWGDKTNPKQYLAINYGQIDCLWENHASIYSITKSLAHFTKEGLHQVLIACATFTDKNLSDNIKKVISTKDAIDSTSFVTNIKAIFGDGSAFFKYFSVYIAGQQMSAAEIAKLVMFALLPTNEKSVLTHMKAGVNFPFEVAAVRPFIELETANAIFCKKGRETAVTYCLPPWTFIGRDNRIEMVDMKFGFWRECHIERPQNILVAEHAFVTRVRNGMDTTWMTESQYMENPMEHHNTCDVFPMITGPLNPQRDLPSLAAIKSNILPEDLKSNYKSLDAELKEYKTDMHEMNIAAGFGQSSMTFSPTLWDGDSLNAGAIPRICALGTTRQNVVEVGGKEAEARAIRYTPSKVLHNKGHMKELDSEKWIGSLCGFALSQVATSESYF